jgi:hypothetical protein
VREDRDELIERIVDELKPLPQVPADATARVLARVDAARRGQGPSAYEDDDVIFFPTATDELPAAASAPSPLRAVSDAPRRVHGGRRFLVSLPAAIGYALAATLAGFLIRGALPSNKSTQVAVTAPMETRAPSTSPAVKTVAGTNAIRESQEAPVAVQFVLDERRAASVAVVGDFNSWDASANPMARDSASGAWTALVNVKPGRHVYAFLVDGKEWTLDPRAQRTRDVDYGTEQSVVIVGLR